jgi:hypothetical protein
MGRLLSVGEQSSPTRISQPGKDQSGFRRGARGGRNSEGGRNQRTEPGKFQPRPLAAPSPPRSAQRRPRKPALPDAHCGARLRRNDDSGRRHPDERPGAATQFESGQGETGTGPAAQRPRFAGPNRHCSFDCDPCSSSRAQFSKYHAQRQRAFVQAACTDGGANGNRSLALRNSSAAGIFHCPQADQSQFRARERGRRAVADLRRRVAWANHLSEAGNASKPRRDFTLWFAA